MMRSLFIIWFLATALSTFAQDSTKKFPVDTIHLTDFYAKKIISYQLNGVTFLVDYKDFMKMYTSVWKVYKRGNQYIADAKKKGEVYNHEAEPRWILIDSIYRYLKATSKHQDTIFLTHTPFNKVGFGTWNNFFPEMIEKNKSAIYNNKGERQYIILRQRSSWYKGPLEAWSGRHYFLMGEPSPFIDATDWIS